MTTISEPSASAMVTTTINAPPLKAATSSQTNSGADDASAPSTSKANSALLELRSLALAAAATATAAAASATADARIVDAMLERFTSLADRFQEVPHLLDPHLPSIIGASLAPALSRAARAGNAALTASLARLLWSAVSARGRKAALRFFPAEVGDFEPVVRVLVGAAGLEAPPVAASAVEDEEDEDEDQDEGDEGGEASASSPSEQAATLARVGAELSSRGAWQARCCLLLWLAHVSTVPFPMALLDASFEAAAGGGGGGDDDDDDDDGGSDEEEGGETAATSSSSWPPLAAAAQAAAVSSLSSPGADRDSAVLALGRLLSRPDAKGRPLRSFARWACSRVTENASGRRRSPSSSSSSLAALGSVEALAQLFARAERGALAEVGPLAWQAAAALLLPQQKGEGGSGSGSSPSALPGVHARRAAAKLASRIAMSVMPPLLMSQQPSPSSLPPPPSSSEASSSQQQQQHRQLRLPAPLSPSAAATAEDVANALLAALRDRDTAVRWAAAKGVSRLAARLPRREDASALLRMCAGPLLSGSDAGDDAAWHGSALALASLARAAAASAGAAGGGSPSSPSLLISTRADARAVATGAAAALSYEVRRGERSVGSHVRDAGAYVAWALARCAAAVVGRGEGEGGEEEEGNESEDKTGDGGGGDGLPLTTRSLARALRPLGPLLLSVSCFDREVNCRRAAAAAFQEGAGRLPPEGKKKEKEEGAGATSDEAETEAEAETGGAFARSLDAVRVGAADFFTLGSRSRAALVAGPAAARLDASYALAAVEALVGRGVGGRGGAAAAAAAAAGKAKAASASTCRGKLWHWERATRELSARALAQVLRSAVESGWCEEGDAKAKAEEGEEKEEKKKKQKKKSPLCPCPSAVAALLLEECGIGASSSSPSSSEPEKRHGALCALAELLGEFKEEEAEKKDDDDGQGTSTSCSSSSSISFLPLDDATLVATAAIPLSFSKLVKGRGGEMVREAAMRLVAARARRASSVLSSRSPAPPSALPRQQQQQPGAEAAAAALAAVGECLRHPSEAVRSSAAEALSCLARASSSSSSSSSPSSSSSSSSSSFESVSLLSESLPRWIRWLSNVNGAGSSGGGGGGSGSGSDGAARAGGAAALGALFGGSESGGELLRSLLPAAPEALRALQAACRLEPDPANRDAEARAAAARALPLVAARVAAASRSSPQSSSSSSSSSSSLPDSIGALLDASADYSTDKRGDVGSWVRGPASKGATELLLLLAAGEGEHEAAAKALAPHVARALARQASERCGRLRGEARDSLRSLLLKAGGEFLPDAGLLAEAVRAADEAHSSSVAVAAALEDGGGDDGDGGNGEGRGLHHLHSRHHAHHHHHRHHHHGGGDDATLALAASLLRIPSYAQEAAAGLAACAGGLDAPLARAAGRALCSAATCASSAAASGPGSSSASAAVVRALVAAWASASSLGEEARLTTPFLKAADALLCGIGEEGAAAGGGGEGAAAGGADEALCAAADPSDPASPSLAQAMLDLTLAACRSCRDPARLCAASALLCHLAGVDGRRRGGGAEGRGSGGGERAAAAAAAVVGRRATAARALRAAASLTGHCYPTVRRAAADNLSLRLLMGIPVVDGDGEGEGKDGRESERARAAVWRESGSSSGGGGGGGTGGGEKGEEQEEVETLARRPDAAAASDLLSETAWDAATPSARAARARLFELLGLPAPGGDAAAGAEEAAAERAAGAQRQSKVGGGGGGVSAAATTTASSSSGYQSLIDAVSRGGAD